MLRKIIVLVIGIFFLFSGCSFNKQVFLKSQPDGATVKIGGQNKGTTPTNVKIGCTTFGTQKVELSKEGYRTLTTELEYKWSGRNVIWSILLLPIGLLLVGKCPLEQYDLELTPEKAELKGKSTLIFVGVPTELRFFVDDQEVVEWKTLVLEPGQHSLKITKDGHTEEIATITLRPNVDYWQCLSEQLQEN